MSYKIVLRLFPISLFGIFLVSCGSSDATVSKMPEKNVAGYNEVFKEMFRSNQMATTEIPKKGIYDFELTGNADAAETGKIDSFAGKTFGESFQSFSTRVYGNYDFNDSTKAAFDSTIKAYLNKGNTGLGDLDLEASINSSGSLEYEIRNLDPRLLEFLKIDPETADAIEKAVERNKSQKQVTELGTNLLKEVLASIEESSRDNPLYQNSKEQEAKIIEAFANSESIKVYSGSSIDDSTERIAFRFDPENFAKFLNETGKILGNGNENKDFSGDAKTLAETLKIEWTVDIREKRIIDSDMKFVIRLGGQDEKTGEKKVDDLVVKVRFSFPNPSKMDFDLDTQLYANSSPDNVLRLRLKWLIK